MVTFCMQKSLFSINTFARYIINAFFFFLHKLPFQENQKKKTSSDNSRTNNCNV